MTTKDKTKIKIPGSRAFAKAERKRLDALEATKDSILATIKADSFVTTFIGMTPQQVIDYVNANVTTVAGARSLLVKISLMMLFLAKENFEE